MGLSVTHFVSILSNRYCCHTMLTSEDVRLRLNEDRCLLPVFHRCLKVKGEVFVADLIEQSVEKHGSEFIATDPKIARTLGGIFLRALKKENLLTTEQRKYVFKSI